MTPNELLLQAVEETKHLHKDEIFLVKELFKGYEWKRISVSDRLLLGALFLNYARTNEHRFKPIEKTSSGQQKYVVISES